MDNLGPVVEHILDPCDERMIEILLIKMEDEQDRQCEHSHLHIPSIQTVLAVICTP